MSSAITHWWVQRLTSVALIPLGVWLVWASLNLAGAGYADAAAFVVRPINAVMIVVTAVIVLHHTQLGIQVVVEDYIPEKEGKLLMAVTRIACMAGGLLVVAAVIKLAMGN